MSTIKRITFQLAGLIYGLLGLTFYGVRAIVEGYIIKKPDEAFWKAVENARNEYWNLSEQPDGFKHAFYTLKNGRILHYVTTVTRSKNETGKHSANLVLFLHGWPDSWMLWSDVMRKSILNSEDTRFVALDLPGFGGSDCLDKHDATQVLEAVTEFALAMRAQYVDPEKSTVLLVAHDWGAVVGFKLASQAPELADRFILMNSTLTESATENISNRARFAEQVFGKWLRQPTRLSLLRSINATILPVVTQLFKSSYIFIFNLPGPLPALFGQLGEKWFIRYAHYMASGNLNAPNSPEAVIHMASSLGPNKVSCRSSLGAEGYGMTVSERADIGAWYSGCRYYSEGLAMKPWKKSLETVIGLHNLGEKRRRSSSGAGIFDEKPGRLKQKTTILWGESDPALQSNIMMEGIKDYFVHNSQLVSLPKLGHWVPLEQDGADAITKVITWALHGEKDTIEEALQGLPDFKVTVRK